VMTCMVNFKLSVCMNGKICNNDANESIEWHHTNYSCMGDQATVVFGTCL
jgi:hypothetical protein